MSRKKDSKTFLRAKSERKLVNLPSFPDFFGRKIPILRDAKNAEKGDCNSFFLKSAVEVLIHLKQGLKQNFIFSEIGPLLVEVLIHLKQGLKL